MVSSNPDTRLNKPVVSRIVGLGASAGGPHRCRCVKLNMQCASNPTAFM